MIYIKGVKTTIPFHRQLMDNEDYLQETIQQIHGKFCNG